MSNNTPLPGPTPLVRSIRESWWYYGEQYMRDRPNDTEHIVHSQTFEALNPADFDGLQPPFHMMADRIRNTPDRGPTTWTYKIVREGGILYRVTLRNEQLCEKFRVDP